MPNRIRRLAIVSIGLTGLLALPADAAHAGISLNHSMPPR